MKRFDPKKGADDEEQNIFVYICIHVLVVEPHSIISIATLDQKCVVTILPQVNDQPRHVNEQNHGVKHIFKLEILHDPLVASCVHRHVKLLEHKHPLEVKDYDEDVCTPVKLFYVDIPSLGVLSLKSKLVGRELWVCLWIFVNVVTVAYGILVFHQIES